MRGVSIICLGRLSANSSVTVKVLAIVRVIIHTAWSATPRITTALTALQRTLRNVSKLQTETRFLHMKLLAAGKNMIRLVISGLREPRHPRCMHCIAPHQFSCPTIYQCQRRTSRCIVVYSKSDASSITQTYSRKLEVTTQMNAVAYRPIRRATKNFLFLSTWPCNLMTFAEFQLTFNGPISLSWLYTDSLRDKCHRKTCVGKCRSSRWMTVIGISSGTFKTHILTTLHEASCPYIYCRKPFSINLIVHILFYKQIFHKGIFLVFILHFVQSK